MAEFRKTQLIGEDTGGTKRTVLTTSDGEIRFAGTQTTMLGDLDTLHEVQSGTINEVDVVHSGSVDVVGNSTGLLEGSGTVSQVDSVGGTVTVDEQRTDTIIGTETKSITTSTGTLATASPDRQNLIVQNCATQVVTVGLPTVASGVGSGGTGIVLNGANSSGQAGGQFSTTEYTGEVHAIAETGTAEVRITEV